LYPIKHVCGVEETTESDVDLYVILVYFSTLMKTLTNETLRDSGDEMFLLGAEDDTPKDEVPSSKPTRRRPYCHEG
jgi:hypothetical protein